MVFLKKFENSKNRKKVIGLPQGMPYHRYGVLWKSFFGELGMSCIVSDSTTAGTVETGSSIAPDEACLAMKIYMGHVASLVGKCDYILVPRLSSSGRRKDQCQHFDALYDSCCNLFRSSGQKFIAYEVDVLHGKTEKDGFLELGRELGFSAREAAKAYAAAKKIDQQNWNKRVALENSRIKKGGLTVFIAGHSYVLEDPYMGKPIRDFLRENNINYISGYICDRDAALKASDAVSPTCKWESNREIIGNLAAKRKNIDGVILLSTFPCGADAMVNDILMRYLQGIPVLNLILDSQSGTAGVETRLESFIDIITFKEGMA